MDFRKTFFRLCLVTELAVAGSRRKNLFFRSVSDLRNGLVFFQSCGHRRFLELQREKSRRQSGCFKRKRSGLLNDQGIGLSSSCAKIQLSWECATEWGKYDEFIYVMCGNFILLIDRNRITEQEYAVLQNLLEEYVSLS